MTYRAINLMDVLAPPENDWLKQLFRRKANLPAGVQIVRFSDIDDDPAEDIESKCSKRKAESGAPSTSDQSSRSIASTMSSGLCAEA
jgi:hypothetical protein